MSGSLLCASLCICAALFLSRTENKNTNNRLLSLAGPPKPTASPLPAASPGSQQRLFHGERSFQRDAGGGLRRSGNWTWTWTLLSSARLHPRRRRRKESPGAFLHALLTHHPAGEEKERKRGWMEGWGEGGRRRKRRKRKEGVSLLWLFVFL